MGTELSHGSQWASLIPDVPLSSPLLHAFVYECPHLVGERILGGL